MKNSGIKSFDFQLFKLKSLSVLIERWFEIERTNGKTRKWRLCWRERMYGQSLYEKCSVSEYTWILSVPMQRKVISLHTWLHMKLGTPKVLILRKLRFPESFDAPKTWSPTWIQLKIIRLSKLRAFIEPFFEIKNYADLV